MSGKCTCCERQSALREKGGLSCLERGDYGENARKREREVGERKGDEGRASKRRRVGGMRSRGRRMERGRGRERNIQYMK